MHTAARTCTLILIAWCIAAPAAAAPPDPWSDDGPTEIRLFLGRLDGAENTTLLHHDAHRYTVGLGASSPVAWEGRMEANLEAWVSERGYGATTTPTGVATESVSLQSASLAYGVRLQTGGGALRPYGLLALGIQGNRLHAARRDDPSVDAIDEETLEPLAQVGAGIEWRVGRDLFALDWRRWYVTSDFTDVDGRDLEVGGEFLGFALGHRW